MQAARADRPRRRGRRRRGGRLRLQERHRAGAARSGSASATCRWRCTCAPSSSCSACARSAASTSRSPVRTCARAACSTSDSAARARLRARRRARARGGARAARRALHRPRGRREARPRRLERRPRDCGSQSVLHVPGDLRVRAMTRRSPASSGGRTAARADRRAGAGGRAARRAAAAVRGRGQRQDLRARRALRQGGAARTASRPGRSSRSRSPSAPPASCASACAARFLELGEREAARDTEAAFVGTFHGFCARLLRAHPLPAGLDPAFTILDEGARGRLRERAFRTALRRLPRAEGARGGRPDRRLRSRPGAGDDRPASTPSCAAAASACRGCRRSARRAPSASARRRDGGRRVPLLDELLGRFARRLRGAQARARRRRLRRPRAARAGAARRARRAYATAWSERFELLMVDEFQDTNPRQLGDPAGARARQPVHGRRRAAVDLRLPPRRRGPLPRRGAPSSPRAARASR